MRIGIFGGTFDPVHHGHLILAEQCREQCRLDEVWFVPAAMPPHKLDHSISPAKSRTEMLELAISGNPQFRVSRIELDRSGPSYTVATLDQLRTDEPANEFFLLVGADSLRDLPTWREPRRILELATIVAVNRGPASVVESDMARKTAENLCADPSRVQWIQMPGIEIAATDIRQRVAAGRTIRYMVPRAVEMYIREHRVYETGDFPEAATPKTL
jgi:nicotinate-nucleotide adenylyltransferase